MHPLRPFPLSRLRVWLCCWLFGAAACAPTLAVNESALVPERVRFGATGVVALASTGESFDLSPLRAAEPGADAAGVQMLKIHGAWIVAGDGFRRLWRLWPAGRDRLKYEPVDFDPGPAGFTRVELAEAGGCALVRWQPPRGGAQVFVSAKGEVDARACRN